MSYYCSDSGSQIFSRSNPHMGRFVLIYWCDCTVQSLDFNILLQIYHDAVTLYSFGSFFFPIWKNPILV